MGRFDYFVVFAEMRTGSNFLEENINDYPGLSCLGELFNPKFIGHADTDAAYGVTMAEREADPLRLLAAVREATEGLAGFRFFNDHDPRILDHVLADPRCGKVILTRNPVDSYVSFKIAQATGQWRLGDMSRAKSALATFEEEDFLEHLERLQAFQLTILRGMQTTGQTGFYIAYEDLNDVEVLDGLARFLGVEHQKQAPSQKTKVQNPKPLAEKVTNFEEMEAALAGLDRFNLNRTPNFEPRRGPMVPKFVAAAKTPVLYQPIPCGPDARVLPWLAALDDVEPDDLRTGFFQKTLRAWKAERPGHRAFSVLRHPVLRLHTAFARHILPAEGDAVYVAIRRTLRETYDVPLPEHDPDDSFGPQAQRKAFVAFAAFVAGNLAGQTGVRVDASWASQLEILRGMAQVQMPDVVIREDELETGLTYLAELLGVAAPPPPGYFDEAPIPLTRYYTAEVENAVRAAFARDYEMFGFDNWSGTGL